MEQIGTFLGRYKLVRVLGRGAMGVVYEAMDEQLHRPVAVKTILKSRLLDPQLTADYSARFQREAQAVARLNHPNIVTVFDFVNQAEVAYLVMEFVLGAELKTYLDDQHVFSIAEVVSIICELLEALDYAHHKGVIHRDIKPANVMLDRNGHVKLTDFGVARLIDSTAPDGTQSGAMVGTPSYMSPEQIRGLPAGAQADLFATGVLLYQCLSLHKPFVGQSEWEIWQAIVNDAPPPLAQYRAGIPPALEQAMLHALAKDPQDRPLGARAFIENLQASMAVPVFDPDATRSGALLGSAGIQPAWRPPDAAGRSTAPTTPTLSARQAERLPSHQALAHEPDGATGGPSHFSKMAAKWHTSASVFGVSLLAALLIGAVAILLWKKSALPLPALPVAPPVLLAPAAPQLDPNRGALDDKERALALDDLKRAFALKERSMQRAEQELAREQSQYEAKQRLALKAESKAAQAFAGQQVRDAELKLKEEKARELARNTLEGAAQKNKDEANVKASADLKLKEEAKNREITRQTVPPKADPGALFVQAQHTEKEGRFSEAVLLYQQAYSAGNGHAARALGDLYGRGNDEVARDYTAQLQWYDKAKAMGVAVPTLGRRKY